MQRWPTIGIITAVLVVAPSLATAQNAFPHYSPSANHPFDGPYQSWGPEGYCPPAGAAYPGPPQTIQELLPDDRGWLYGHGDVDEADVFLGSWIRFEYLLWRIKRPGGVRIGAPTASIDPETVDFLNPYLARNRDQSPRIEPGALPLPILARATDLGSIGDQTLNGVRASFGLPTTAGAFEANIWVLQQGSGEVIRETEIEPLGFGIGIRVLPAIPLLEGGVPSDAAMLVFDDGMSTLLESSLYGAEANWVYNSVTPGILPLQISPMLGAKYVRFRERLSIRGHDQATLTNPRINSVAVNHIFGPQIGVRTELHAKRLTLGAEPKVTFAVNRHRDRVTTAELFDPPLPVDATPEEIAMSARTRQVSREQHNDFSAVFDLNLYARLALTENLSVNVGYNLMLFSEVSRPFDNIFYNDNGLNTPSAIEVLSDRRSFYSHGLMVGGEYVFR